MNAIFIYKVYDRFASEGNETKYLTTHDGVWYEGSGVLIPIEVIIPDRFKLDYTVNGQPIVQIDCDGDGKEEGYLLSEVLGTDTQGNPAIVWEDSKHGYLHRVRLEVVE